MGQELLRVCPDGSTITCGYPQHPPSPTQVQFQEKRLSPPHTGDKYKTEHNVALENLASREPELHVSVQPRIRGALTLLKQDGTDERRKNFLYGAERLRLPG